MPTSSSSLYSVPVVINKEFAILVATILVRHPEQVRHRCPVKVRFTETIAGLSPFPFVRLSPSPAPGVVNLIYCSSSSNNNNNNSNNS